MGGGAFLEGGEVVRGDGEKVGRRKRMCFKRGESGIMDSDGKRKRK